MEIPDLVRQALGDEDVRAGVSLGDEDAICLTPTRTIVYHGESLLSDESVEEYSHNVERLSVKEGRRKTKFVLEYVDGTESFTVPSNRGENVLEVLLEGVLKVDGVIGQQESLAGVYRFSELTLVISERRLIKHIGQAVWDDDFESYVYDDVTGLEFEEASVATSISLVVGGRPERIKVPSDEGPMVRRKLEGALFEYYDVASLDELNRALAADEEPDPEPDRHSEDGDDLDFGSGIDPLVTSDPDEDAQPALSEQQQPRDAEPGGQTRQGPQGGQPRQDSQGGQPRQEQQGGQSRQGQPGGQQPEASDQRSSARAQQGRETSQQADRSAPADREQDAPAQQGRSGDAERREQRSEAAESDQAPRQSKQQSEPATEQPRSEGDAETRSDPAHGESAAPGGQSADAASAGQSGASSSGQSAASNAGQSDPTTSAEAASPQPEQETGAGQDRDRTAESEQESGAEAADEDAAAEEWFDHDADATAEEASELVAELGYEPASRDEVAAVTEQLSDLTDAVERQNELLNRQHKAITQLVEELRDE